MQQHCGEDPRCIPRKGRRLTVTYTADNLLGPVKAHFLIVAVLAFWLAFGPAASAWAQSADVPCESMGMTTPADDCCCDCTNPAACLIGCPVVSPAMTAPAVLIAAPVPAASVVAALPFRHANVLAPPDIAPPKSRIS